MLQTELPHVALVQKQRLSVFFSRNRRRVGAVIKDGNFSHSCPSAFDMNHLFPAIRTFPKSPDGTFYDHIQAARLFSADKQHFVFSKTAMYCKGCYRTQRLIA